ncbi:ribosome biogenesis GTPase Der [Planctomicrobium piriforme]|uniref:GTPase Der n=1 Tax=Planctomicrobium piriforme TaxID=1576369 RepID=A0A1I3D5J2_9PLAN|nr:ribosome biogenesis GTPase Der [Planctomicrobium piriforme]SFH81819.1 GTP-binding protein [Planctomicrobium piriforme]
MPIPKVAIVGRPNVGKSSIMNWQAGRLVSVVDPTAGVTRDRVDYLMHHQGRYFELVDTGGIGVVDSDDLSDDIENQIQFAIDQANLILFVVDGRVGLTVLDKMVAERLRKIDVPKLIVVNKCDSIKTDMEMHEFNGVADAPMLQTSVKGNRHREELLHKVVELLPEADADEQQLGEDREHEPELKLAVVGRRNVGKSTFINALAQTERMIVSEIAGTTRDSVDIRFDLDGKSFVAIDTPGVRKRKSLANDIEYYGLVRAQKSIRRADVVLMFFDSTDKISRVDKKLVDEILERNKACIFVINKWDLGLEKEMTSEKWSEYLLKTFGSLRHVPVAFITAKDSRNIKQLINLTQSVYKQSRERVTTGQLNRIVEEACAQNAPRFKSNKRGKIFYATQVATEPPTIILKCNDPELFDKNWKRYLIGKLREELPYKEVPIKVYFRGKAAGEDENSPAPPRKPPKKRTSTKGTRGDKSKKKSKKSRTR